MNLTADTKIVSLLGNPVKHSLSAAMHNAAFQALNLNYIYLPIQTNDRLFGHIIDCVRYMNFKGLSVTKPDKLRILSYLDDMDELAAKIGAVNTVLKDDCGMLKGFNTDGLGFIKSLEENTDQAINELAYMCIGAGGAARAICFSILEQGCRQLIISSLYDEESMALKNDLSVHYQANIQVIPWNDPDRLTQSAASTDVILNTTGVGMEHDLGKSPVNCELFTKGKIAFDAAYAPRETQFLTDAKSRGCKTFNGLGMLLYQGAAQFELWTGQEAPVELMRKVLEEQTLQEFKRK